MNPAFERTLGFTTAEILVQSYFELIHPDDHAATVAELDRLANNGATRSFECRFRCKDGSYRWLAWTAVPIIEDGLIYAVGRDITERRRAEQELRDLNARLEELVRKRTTQLAEAIVALETDIAERPRIEQALQAQRDFALQVMNTMGQGLVVADTAWNVRRSRKPHTWDI